MPNTKIKHQDFFVIRTPRMPIESLLPLGTTREQSRNALNQWIARPEVKEALYLASPSLLERFEKNRDYHSAIKEKTSTMTLKGVKSKRENKIELALLKYMIRMCSRPTPFGLFSGIHMGKFSSDTTIISDDMSNDGRNTRLDIFYLSAVKEYYSKLNKQSKKLKYYPNTSHYFVADHCRYIEAYQSDKTRHYRLSAIESDESFLFLLELAKKGLTFEELVTAALNQYAKVKQDDVETYIEQLIDEAILVADIALPLTGSSPDIAFLNSLNNIGEEKTAAHLSLALSQLKQIDHQKQGKVTEYKSLLKHINQLPVKAQENKLFQADVYRSFKQCEIDNELSSSLLTQLKLIKGLSANRRDVFSDFINQFNQRFEGQFVPIDLLLDDESGINFSTESGYVSPLLTGLELVKHSSSFRSASPPSILDNLVTQAISLPRNRNKSVITLKTNELKHHLDKPLSDAEFPASFAAMISLFEDKDKKTLIKFNGCYGPSAANLLGRFCHLNGDLKQNMIAHLERESALSPNVIFAEIAHMPEGRPGNVIARPHLSQYEIVFLADSSLASEFQIPLNDLYVWVEHAQVKLWSKRLNKQIIPRLSSAHNYSARSLSAYKFLCTLQHQGASTPSFSLPDSQSGSCFVPRIMLDNLILSEKTWRIPREELLSLLNNSEVNRNNWLKLKDKYQLDENIAIAMSDNVLQLNLTNPMMLEILLAETKGLLIVELKEVLTTQYKTLVKSNSGLNYANEAIIPFHNASAKPHKHFNEDPEKNIANFTNKRRFSPGSQWLSLKIYSGNTAIDTLLAEHLLPLIETNKSDYEKWFFIRYGDPDWHLRLRFYGVPKILGGLLLAKLNHLLSPMIESGEINKIELFTYEREIERYGGNESMEQVEKFFMADSLLVAKTVQTELEYAIDIRWRVTLLMTDKLLTAFGYSVVEKLNLIGGLRSGFGKEFNESSKLRKQLGAKFKTIQNTLKTDFSQLIQRDSKNYETSEIDPKTQKVFALVDSWFSEALPIVKKISQHINSSQGLSCSLDSLLSSILHMHNNRMFKAYGREHELVMHDFLRRHYFSINKRM